MAFVTQRHYTPPSGVSGITGTGVRRLRNHCPAKIGTGVRLKSEWVSGRHRNTHLGEMRLLSEIDERGLAFTEPHKSRRLSDGMAGLDQVNLRSKNKAVVTTMTEKKTESPKMAALRKKVETLEKAMKAIQTEMRKSKV